MHITTKKSLRIAALAATGALAFGGLTACSTAPSGPVTISVWAQEGQAGEVATAKAEVEAFNAANTGKITAVLELKPQGDYGKVIKATAASALPDVYEFDGETAGALVYDGKLLQLNDVIAKSTWDAQLSSLQAECTVNGKEYCVSQYDSGLALYGNKKMLAAAGVTFPTTIDKAWTADQFQDALKKIAAYNTANGGKAIDIMENYGIDKGWSGYAFTPIVNSAGFPLVGANGLAAGSLDNAKVAAALTQFASWKTYVDPSADGKAFQNGRVPLAWTGHWMYPDYSKALGSDLVAIPLPDFGNGTKSGQGSHSWGIGSKTTKKEASAKFLEFITSDKWVTTITDANGAVPATKAALAASKVYGAGGTLELYGQQLAKTCGSAAPTKDCVTVPRTISPAWPVINDAFNKAMGVIYNGGNAQQALSDAAKTIDQDAKDHNNYK
jgi:multiple sugar transport system substrate-binding protein